MKYMIRIIAAMILVLMVATTIQGQEEYRKITLNVGIPILADSHVKIHRFADGSISEKKSEQAYTISFYVALDDLKLEENSFSGIKITTYPVSEEIVIVHGVLSADHQKIETLNIEYQFIKYSQPDRSKAHLEEKKTGSIVFKNIPKKYSNYSFNSEVTEISKAEWATYKFLKYVGSSETTKTYATAVDKEKISKYTTCITVGWRTTNLTPRKKTYNKVAVATAGCQAKESVSEKCGPIKGISASLIHKLTQIQSLTVLERENLNLILNEQKLSESGLVDAASKVESGNIIDEEILIIIELQKPNPDDDEKMWTYRAYIKNQITGELKDTNLQYRAGTNEGDFRHFVNSIYAHVMKNYLS